MERIIIVSNILMLNKTIKMKTNTVYVESEKNV